MVKVCSKVPESCSSFSLVSVLSAEGDGSKLEHPLLEERFKLDELLLLEPEVRRLGVKRLMKSSMVLTGDFSSNLVRTLKRQIKQH